MSGQVKPLFVDSWRLSSILHWGYELPIITMSRSILVGFLRYKWD